MNCSAIKSVIRENFLVLTLRFSYNSCSLILVVFEWKHL